MKKIYIILTTIFVGFLLNGCEVTDFDLQDNPDELGENSVSPDFLLNQIQILFVESMSSISTTSDDVMRYEAMVDTYADTAEPESLNGEWDDIYALRQNVKIMETLAEENDALLFHRGIAKILNAYSFATLVDYLGDIPYSEANDASNFNPIADDDAAIYASLLEDLDLAIIDLEGAIFKPALDIYFGNSSLSVEEQAGKWIKVAKSLKLRMYINMGETSEINLLVEEGDLIDSSSDDFVFQYSTAVTPDSRHPYFIRGYLSEGFSEYMGNYFMWLLKDSKRVTDPRLRYYIYRQTNVDPTGSFNRCSNNLVFDYCYIGGYYWGRDHGDDSNSPNDNALKSTYGIYPGGGAFDANNATAASKTTNMKGAGIFPVLLSSYVKFLQAEAVLSLGTNGDAKTLLEEGIRASMSRVLNFSSVGVSATYAATSIQVENYVSAVMTEYAAAFTTAEKLDIVVREYYLASYGNSIEAYNAYRRTGYPSNIQIPIKNETIPFPRTFSLPASAVDTNTSLNQRPITDQVFWDTKAAGFIN